jgi:hypothetical protein
MAGTELPLLGAAIKYYGYYGQATPQISFRNVGGGKLQPVIPPPQQLSNFMAGLVNLFAAEQKVAEGSGFCPIIPRPAQPFI